LYQEAAKPLSERELLNLRDWLPRALSEETGAGTIAREMPWDNGTDLLKLTLRFRTGAVCSH
jgi:hypothetical protein